VLDHGTPEEREAIHALVKEHANGWWHRFANVWFVGGRTAAWWRDTLRPAKRPGSSILVLRLPDPDGRAWASIGPNSPERFHWLHATYTKNPDYE
jgi:hypothetical protein